MSHRPDRTSLLLQVSDGQIKKFFDILAIYKNDKLFEYKFALTGFPKDKQVRFSEGGILHARKGIISKGKERAIFGGMVEIGFHFDGKTAYKDPKAPLYHQNYFVTQLPRIDRIHKPFHFLRITGFDFDYLLPRSGKSSKKVASIVTMPLSDNLRNSPLVVDLWFSHSSFYILPTDGDVEVHVVNDDQRTELNLTMHIYKADQNAQVSIMVIPNTFLSRSFSRYYYYLQKIKSFLNRAVLYVFTNKRN